MLVKYGDIVSILRRSFLKYTKKNAPKFLFLNDANSNANPRVCVNHLMAEES